MSGAPDADLRGRLEAVLAQAQADGQVQALRPLLEAFLRQTTLPAAAVASDGVPMRFGMVGDSAVMQTFFATLERVAKSDVAVLVQGETGTGKELVARALHECSARARKAFVAENCAAVSPSLLESELFGHKKGAFTGAIADRDGCFVSADGGTMFLDEVGDMPLPMQAKLLRVLEAGEVRPVGASRSLHVDLRVVAATNRDLEAMVAAGSFRQDLLYRLNVVNLCLPPLRERHGDVAHLVRFFLQRLAPGRGIAPEALAELGARPWPGNVRQLENELRRALTLGGHEIELDDLSPPAGVASPPSTA